MTNPKKYVKVNWLHFNHRRRRYIPKFVLLKIYQKKFSYLFSVILIHGNFTNPALNLVVLQLWDEVLDFLNFRAIFEDFS